MEVRERASTCGSRIAGMDWIDLFALVLMLVFIIQCLRLAVSDCDLTLQWAEKFGKSTSNLKNKVVWITGASSGIGEALSYKLAVDGCQLILSARREDRLQQVKQECLKRSNLKKDDILVLPLDMLDHKTHSSAVENVIKYFKKIDILVNNAGRSQRSLIERCGLEVDRQILEVNTLGPISLTKAVLPYFIKQKSGHVVFTSSIAGKIGSPGLASYSCSKHALQGWFDSLRIEMYTNNIYVTSVCPGPVFSEALIHAFTDDPDKTLGVTMNPKEKRMTAYRCATLMAIAMANKLDEIWVSPHPELLFVYLFQYMPSLAKRLGKIFGQNRIQKIKLGVSDLHGYNFSS